MASFVISIAERSAMEEALLTTSKGSVNFRVRILTPNAILRVRIHEHERVRVHEHERGRTHAYDRGRTRMSMRMCPKPRVSARAQESKACASACARA